LYGVAVGGRTRIGQILLAIYFALGLLLVLKVFDHFLRTALTRLLRADAKGSHPVWRGIADVLSFAVRVCVLIGVGLPYIMAAVMTYRPKVAPADDPQKQLGYRFEAVAFRTSDGLDISAWWIPAAEQPRRRA